MLMREEVQLWSLVRVEAELTCIKAWLCRQLHFDQNLGLWSEVTYNMEILEREKNHHATLECEVQGDTNVNRPWPHE